MPASTAADQRYWWTPVGRAALAAIPGFAITFVPDHSAAFGLTVFGSWAVVSGAVLGALWLRQLTGTTRVLFLVNAVVTVVAGLVGLSLLGAGLAFFLFLVSTWAAVTGFVELFAGIRARAARSGERSASARDWIAVGVTTAVLAVVFLLLPPNDVVAVGLLGAYFVVVAVYLAIAGFSLKFDREPKADADAAPARTEP